VTQLDTQENNAKSGNLNVALFKKTFVVQMILLVVHVDKVFDFFAKYIKKTLQEGARGNCSSLVSPPPLYHPLLAVTHTLHPFSCFFISYILVSS